MSGNPPSKRYPFETDLAELPRGAQRAIRNAWNAITDLQQANIVNSGQITTLQKSGTGSQVATKPISDPPILFNPELGILPLPISGRVGLSPGGGTSPNSSATSDTNSSYAKGAYSTGVTQQTGATYVIQNTDYGGTVILNSATSISISLNNGVTANFTSNIMNIGAGTIMVSPLIVALVAGGAGYLVNDVLTITQGGAAGGTITVTSVNAGVVTGIQLTDAGTGYVVATGLATTGGTGAGCTVSITQIGLINNVGSVTFQSGAFTVISFDGMNWWAMAFTGVLPQTFAPIPGEFLTGYNAATGVFSAAYATASNPYKAVSGTYAILVSDYQIDCTSGTFTVTLPTAIGTTGQSFSIKNSGVGVITLATTLVQTIDGSATQTLAALNSLIVMSNGANWIIIAKV